MRKPGQIFDGFVPGAYLIEAYGAGGFRFAGMSHVGSILATPEGISAIADFDPSALTRLFMELAHTPGLVEFVIIGMGEKMAPAPKPIADALRARGLRFEAMATGPASRVYNVMLDEGRRVAALLIAAP